MKQKLLLLILPMLLLTVTLKAQNHVWDFGTNSSGNWPLNATALATTTVVDGLTLEPGGGSGFGVVDANNTTWFSGTPQEYVSSQRFKMGGKSDVDPAVDGTNVLPTSRYITFPVSG